MNMGGGYLNALLHQPIFGSIVIKIYSEIWSDNELVNDIENILSHILKSVFTGTDYSKWKPGKLSASHNVIGLPHFGRINLGILVNRQLD